MLVWIIRYLDLVPLGNKSWCIGVCKDDEKTVSHRHKNTNSDIWRSGKWCLCAHTNILNQIYYYYYLKKHQQLKYYKCRLEFPPTRRIETIWSLCNDLIQPYHIMLGMISSYGLWYKKNSFDSSNHSSSLSVMIMKNKWASSMAMTYQNNRFSIYISTGNGPGRFLDYIKWLDFRLLQKLFLAKS